MHLLAALHYDADRDDLTPDDIASAHVGAYLLARGLHDIHVLQRSLSALIKALSK